MLLNETVSFLREDEARTERWAHLTEGIGSDYQKKVLETLLDNARALSERRLVGARWDEQTSTDDIAAFNRVAYPLIRRIYPDLVANELVSVQPTQLPVTMVFFLDFNYGTDIAPTAAGDRNDYEAAGKFNRLYGSGAVRGEVLGAGDAAETTFQTRWYPIRPGSVTVYVDAVAEPNVTVDTDTGAVVFDAAPAAGAALTIDYNLVMEGLGGAGNAQIPELELEMSSAQVGVESKKLAAKWTIETSQDLAAYHGLSAEAELTKALGREIRQEIDRTIITDLLGAATAGNVNWDSVVPADTKIQDHNETLMHAFGDVSMEIYKKRLRHANFLVMAPDTLNILDKTNAFRLTAGAGADGKTTRATISSGPNVMGTLANRYRVIVDPTFPTNKVLVGYKGDEMAETGYVYAPYVAFQTKTFIDPKDMTPRKGLMTRFGRHLVNGDYYGTVTIA